MFTRQVRRNALHVGFVLPCCLAAVAAAQIPAPQWSDRFASGDLDHGVLGYAYFDDDGAGPHPARLCLGGVFTQASNRPANYVAIWNGLSWSPLGSGMNAFVRCLAVFDDDGPGPHAAELYAGGEFSTAGGGFVARIAKWNGTSWSSVGTGMNGHVYALAVYDDDGAGPHLPALYAGGQFSTAGGLAAAHVARWNGSAWAQVGGGTDDYVRMLQVFDADGAGPAAPVLIAGGAFGLAGAGSARNIARWNGTAWSAMGTGVDGSVWALGLYDEDDAGPLPARLYVGGSFLTAGGVSSPGLARWNGSSWSAVAGGVDGQVLGLESFDDDGPGPNKAQLYVGGTFTQAGTVPANKIARWNGSQWSALGSGVDVDVRVMAVFDDDDVGPNPPVLLVTGGFYNAGGIVTESIVRWTGSAWVGPSRGMDGGLGPFVNALTVFDRGGPAMIATEPTSFGAPTPARPVLVAGGDFPTAGGRNASRVAQWNGTSWSPMGAGMNDSVRALAQFRNPRPSAEGFYNTLYAGGLFTTAGSAPAQRIARWNGTSWAALGGGVSGGATPQVLALAPFEQAEGQTLKPQLYVGGLFTTAGTASANNIAAWSGSRWSSLGSGVGGQVNALAIHDDDGAGPHQPALYVGGAFTTAGAAPVTYIARWDGAHWSAVGGPLSAQVNTLAVFDEDGPGPMPPALFAGGFFLTVEGLTANNVARWDGAHWTPVGDGFNFGVRALCVFDDDGDGPNPPALYAGGSFDLSGAAPVNRIAKWNGASWEPLATGVDNFVRAMAVHDDDGDGPQPPALYVGGYFATAGGLSSSCLAAWLPTGYVP